MRCTGAELRRAFASLIIPCTRPGYLGRYAKKMPVLLPSSWIEPFYLNILHGNYATDVVEDGQRVAFNAAVEDTLETVTAEQLSRLIGSSCAGGYYQKLVCGCGRVH